MAAKLLMSLAHHYRATALKITKMKKESKKNIKISEKKQVINYICLGWIRDPKRP